MKKPISAHLRLIFLLGDLVILNFSAFGAAAVYPISGSVISLGYLSFMFIMNVLWLFLALLVVNPYKFSRVSRFAKILRSHFSFVLIYLLLAATLISFTNLVEINVKNSLMASGLLISLLFIWRIFFFYLNKIVINRKLNFKNVVIVGFGELGWEMRKFFRLHPEYGYKFLGYFDQHTTNRDVSPLDNIEDFCKTNNVHEIYCCLPYVDNLKVKGIIDFGLANLIRVKLITDYRGFFSRGVRLERYDNIPILKVAAVPLDERNNQLIKRIFDILFSGLIILLLLSWITPIVALLIKLDSKGPVFFKQRRAGKDNTPFNCLKFRTLIVHHAEFKQVTKNDDRITFIGKFLRKTSLDEFPQFINVLKGQMSIIGPRPHPIKLNEEFSPKIEKFMARQYVKPGITGLAQAKGFRGETKSDLSMKGRVKLDRFYIENWTFLLDIKILIATIIALAKGDQEAY